VSIEVDVDVGLESPSHPLAAMARKHRDWMSLKGMNVIELSVR
jgi:hypothetical protein